MCRKRAPAATLLTLSLMAGVCWLPAAPVQAAGWPFGDRAEKTAASETGRAAAKEAAAKPVPAPALPAAPQKASAAERIEARRLDPLAAAAFWGRQVEIDPRDAEAGIGLSQSLRALRRFQDAAAAAQTVLVVDPGNLNALLESARAWIGMGQGFYAIEPARKAAALSPRDWRPVALLAVAYEQAQRDEEALAAHQQAATLAPNEPAVLSNYAMYQAARGDLPGAERLLRRAAAAPQLLPTVRQNLALVVGLQGRLDEAERLARQDLPPEMVASNMAWLKAALAKPAAGGTGGTPAGGRSWQSVTQPGG
jgi:Flp pilus assembly protein TadD